METKSAIAYLSLGAAMASPEVRSVLVTNAEAAETFHARQKAKADRAPVHYRHHRTYAATQNGGGAKEAARRLRQILVGSLKEQNGLTLADPPYSFTDRPQYARHREMSA